VQLTKLHIVDRKYWMIGYKTSSGIKHYSKGLPCYHRIALVLSILLLSFVSATSWAQSPQQWKKHGDAAAKEGDLNGAIYYYQKAADSDSSNLEYWMPYANALRRNHDYLNAASAYQLIFENPFRTKYEESLYWWAMMLQNLGNYEEAAHNFKNYSNYHAEKGSFLQLNSDQQFKSCIWAMKHETDSLIKEIRNLGSDLNSNYTEFGGTLLNDSTLVYSSLQYDREDSSLVLTEKDKANRVMLYSAVWRDSIWVDLGNLDSSINERGVHTANACWFEEKQWLIYSSCSDYSHCKIKYSEWDGQSWSEPEELAGSINLEGFNNTQPFLCTIKGKTTLFFASNRPQGKGQLDIWYAQYNKRLKGFTYPRNMGKKVNSPGNEITPYFLSDSNRLFFSSDWHYGYGGFDVFSSEAYSLRSVKAPANAGQVINSPANDLYFRSYPSNSVAFVTSNREGGFKLKNQTCCNDIYYFEHEAPILADTVDEVDSTLLIPKIETVAELNNYLPVLYFHNDQPNPRSLATTTSKTYHECFEEYLGLKKRYLKEYTRNKTGNDRDSSIKRIDHFFKKKVEGGIEEFDLFMDLLYGQLQKGQSVVITIKGYASPLAASDYNIHLTKRRIESLVNYLYVYKEGEIAPYIDGTAKNGAKIEFVKIPFGDSKAARTTSDDLKDKINSVYSPDAMEERRIEILHVDLKE